MTDPADKLKLASKTLLEAETELEAEQLVIPHHEAVRDISAARQLVDKVASYTVPLDELPPAPVVPPKPNK
jgi:hypothetical protein